MARQAWQRTITDAAGNVLTGVQITVFQADGVTLATIYGQLTGGSALANPFNTGLQTSAKFYADPGRYVVRAFKDGLTQEFTDVDIGGKAVRDDLGSAAYLVASTSVGDTTTGRAARIGDHGLGLDGNDMTRVTPVLDYSGGVDFNTITAPGWHKVLVNASSSSNYPPFGANSGYWYIHVLKYGSTQLQQYAYTYMIGNTDPHVVWVRARYNGTWTTWQQASTPTIGPVGFDATIGRSTGAIIERGSNSNGDFVKFADGTLICMGARVGALGTNAYAGVTNLRASEYTWFYPAAFLAGTVPTIAGHGGDQSYAGWISAIAVSSTQCNVAYFTATVSPTAFIYPIAIGRWR